jgi:hypothetical protein
MPNEDKDSEAVRSGAEVGGEVEAEVAAGRHYEAKLREEQRKSRAAAKLRENLMRRKSQARARRAGDADETVGLPAAKKDESA